MFGRIAFAVTDAIISVDLSPEKHSAYLFFSEHTFNFFHREKRQESGMITTNHAKMTYQPLLVSSAIPSDSQLQRCQL